MDDASRSKVGNPTADHNKNTCLTTSPLTETVVPSSMVTEYRAPSVVSSSTSADHDDEERIDLKDTSTYVLEPQPTNESGNGVALSTTTTRKSSTFTVSPTPKTETINNESTTPPRSFSSANREEVADHNMQPHEKRSPLEIAADEAAAEYIALLKTRSGVDMEETSMDAEAINDNEEAGPTNTLWLKLDPDHQQQTLLDDETRQRVTMKTTSDVSPPDTVQSSSCDLSSSTDHHRRPFLSVHQAQGKKISVFRSGIDSNDNFHTKRRPTESILPRRRLKKESNRVEDDDIGQADNGKDGEVPREGDIRPERRLQFRKQRKSAPFVDNSHEDSDSSFAPDNQDESSSQEAVPITTVRIKQDPDHRQRTRRDDATHQSVTIKTTSDVSAPYALQLSSNNLSSRTDHHRRRCLSVHQAQAKEMSVFTSGIDSNDNNNHTKSRPTEAMLRRSCIKKEDDTVDDDIGQAYVEQDEEAPSQGEIRPERRMKVLKKREAGPFLKSSEEDSDLSFARDNQDDSSSEEDGPVTTTRIKQDPYHRQRTREDGKTHQWVTMNTTSDVSAPEIVRSSSCNLASPSGDDRRQCLSVHQAQAKPISFFTSGSDSNDNNHTKSRPTESLFQRSRVKKENDSVHGDDIGQADVKEDEEVPSEEYVCNERRLKVRKRRKVRSFGRSSDEDSDSSFAPDSQEYSFSDEEINACNKAVSTRTSWTGTKTEKATCSRRRNSTKSPCQPGPRQQAQHLPRDEEERNDNNSSSRKGRKRRIYDELDLSDVPDQPPILRFDPTMRYTDHTPIRRRVGANASKYMGVTRDSGKWKAQIYHPIQKRTVSLGYFHDDEVGARVYAKAAYKLKQMEEPRRFVFRGVDLLKEVPDQPLVRRARYHPKLKYKGVSKNKNSFEARLQVPKRKTNLYLGVWGTQEEAAAIVAKASYVLNQRKDGATGAKAGKGAENVQASASNESSNAS